MTYHSLLVHLDNDRRAEARIAYALRVARELGCRIVGAAPTGSVPLDTQASIGTSASLADFADAVWMALDERAQAARERFEKACRKAGVESPESVVEHADKAQSLVRLSHCSDIVVLSQAEPDAPDFTGARDLVADVILQSARPSIVLPFAGTFDTVASRVVVAWDDSRAAVRAIADALPLLRLAREVQVVTWERASSTADAGLPARQQGLRRWLDTHGVAAELRVARTGLSLTEALLSRASDFDADLVVMGAYGHQRWTERLLGGMTQGVLAAMTVPVLMSH
jgi:nucleotide-binding universal stress UspA family protein